MAAVTHRFHLAVPVDDLAAAAEFYGGVLGCPMGRSAETWIDWDLYGHQLVTHLDEGAGGGRFEEGRARSLRWAGHFLVELKTQQTINWSAM